MARRAVVPALVLAVALSPALGPEADVDAKSACGSDMALVDVHARPGAPSAGPGAAPRRVCVDRWEASVEVGKGTDRTRHSPYEPVPKDAPFRAVSRPGVVPQAHVSRHEAEAACKAAGKRLCTETEWVSACEGKDPTSYPYGPDRRAGLCNDDGVAPVPKLHGELGEAAYASYSAMNDARLNQQPKTLAKTGSHGRCKSSYGVYDMVGNVHEWTSGEAGGGRGVFRGGYYLDVEKNGAGCRYRTDAHDPGYRDYSTGFRCCKDAR